MFVAYLGLHIGLSKVFKDNGIESWKAFIPVYSEILWCQLVGRPTYYAYLSYIPILGFFIKAGMLVDLARSYGKTSIWHHIAIIVFPFIYVPLMAFNKENQFLVSGYTDYHDWKKALHKAAKEKDDYTINKLRREKPHYVKNSIREWFEAIVFAVFAAHFIRLLFFEAYTIPTPSMESSFLVGDFLFVSKAHYGIRLPMTPISFPLLHNMLPTGQESYSKAIEWPYYRLPGFSDVKLYDPVVFNFPEGDSVYGGYVDFSAQYHNLVKIGGNRSVLAKDKRLVVRPVDKRDHYIKRCLGIPGNKVEIREGLVYIDDQLAEELPGIQYAYRVYAQQRLDVKTIEENYGVTFDRMQTAKGIEVNQNVAYMSRANAEKLANLEVVDRVERILQKPGHPDKSIFPYNEAIFPWNIDNYGPIVIPAKGVAIPLNTGNIDLYRRIIAAYEGNTLEIKGNDIYINGTIATSYTPKMDYYWMMGDNRNQSADSRSWGFVPEDHIVGKPLFIAFSTRDAARGGGIRMDRIFKGANSQ